LYIVFILMGGEAGQIQSFQHRVQALGLGAAFRFIGTRPTAETLVAIRTAHILVSPRSRGTNTPSKIYAYLQAGKPIVATNVEAHTQVLNSEVAILVDPSAEALARGLCALLGNSALADQLGMRARLLFERQYSIRRCIEQTNQALQFLITEKGASGA
jgi:glycosyltransferase involved in cell wall biosynthesis